MLSALGLIVRSLLTLLAEPCPVDPEAEGRIGNKIDVLVKARRKPCRTIRHRKGIVSRFEGKRVVEARQRVVGGAFKAYTLDLFGILNP